MTSAREESMRLKDLVRISDYEWEIPRDYRGDMRVPVRIFATRELLEAVLEDKSLEQGASFPLGELVMT